MASPSHTVSTATISCSPAATIAEIAPASAHEPCGYAAFSTLQPENTRPLAVRTAAPTRNREYGAWAFSCTAYGRGKQLIDIGRHQPITVGTLPIGCIVALQPVATDTRQPLAVNVSPGVNRSS